MILKTIIREMLIFLHLDLTKNLKYDRLTKIILKKHIKKNYNCIDVGCHKGEILDLMLKYAPEGRHYAFEPIPDLYAGLAEKYADKASIFPYALSDQEGETTFQFVKNAPAYSGIRKRRYAIDNPEIQEINVALKTLDGLLAPDERIDFIKIDVEGAEFDVMKGAKNILKKNRPVVLFECGKGASDYYGTTPSDVYDFISAETGLKLYTLDAWIKNKKPMSVIEFEHYFNTNEEYYFIAGSGK